MNNADQHQRSLLSDGRYAQEKNNNELDFPGGALATVLVATVAIAGIFALKNAVINLINSIPFFSQFIN